jgi:DNA-binding response OmpR family regulator
VDDGSFMMHTSIDTPAAAEPVRVLVLDDDQAHVELVRRALVLDGLVVDVATTVRAAAALAGAVGYDALVLDVVLPDGDGIELLARWRAEGLRAPVLVLTGQGTDGEAVRALDAGADDFVAKPIAVRHLQARLRALLRRREGRGGAVLHLGELALDPVARTVTADGTPVPLPPREFALLAALLRHPGVPRSRAELLAEVWRMSFDPGTNVVDVHISRLRRALRMAGVAARIETRRGVGYAIAEPVSAGGPSSGASSPARRRSAAKSGDARSGA